VCQFELNKEKYYYYYDTTRHEASKLKDENTGDRTKWSRIHAADPSGRRD